MKLIDGKIVSEQLLTEISKNIQQHTNIRSPHLAIVMVGNHPASETYVNAKIKTCEKFGFKGSLYKYPESIKEKELLSEIQKLNEYHEIDGVIVQLPLPKHISEHQVIETISPNKDVDGFHPINIGRMAKNLPALLPATPGGILELLKFYQIETVGKHCVVIGRSNIVGSPMSILMGRNGYPGNCTVSLCHSKTQNLEFFLKNADIIIAAAGQPELVKGDMVKEGVVVIDVGIHRVPDTSKKSGYRLIGDVEFETVAPKSSFITPVPGGVGPMTIAVLLKNTYLAWQQSIINKKI